MRTKVSRAQFKETQPVEKTHSHGRKVGAALQFSDNQCGAAIQRKEQLPSDTSRVEEPGGIADRLNPQGKQTGFGVSLRSTTPSTHTIPESGIFLRIAQRIVINISPKESELGLDNLAWRRFGEDRLIREEDDNSDHRDRYHTLGGTPPGVGVGRSFFSSQKDKKRAAHAEKRQADLFQIDLSGVGLTEPVIFAGHGIVEHVSIPGGKGKLPVAGSQQGYTAEDFFEALAHQQKGLPKGYRGVIYLQGCRTASGVKEDFSDSLAKKLFLLLKDVFPAIVVKGNMGESESRHPRASTGLMIRYGEEHGPQHAEMMKQAHLREHPDSSKHYFADLRDIEIARRKMIHEKRNKIRRLVGFESVDSEDDLSDSVDRFVIDQMDSSLHYSSAYQGSRRILRDAEMRIRSYERTQAEIWSLLKSAEEPEEMQSRIANELLNPEAAEGDPEEDERQTAEAAKTYVEQLREKAGAADDLDQRVLAEYSQTHGKTASDMFTSEMSDERMRQKHALHSQLTPEEQRKLAQAKIQGSENMGKIAEIKAAVAGAKNILQEIQDEQKEIREKSTRYLQMYRLFEKVKEDREKGMLNFFDLSEVIKTASSAEHS